MKNQMSITCSRFESLSSSEQGTIAKFDTNGPSILFSSCLFNKITSSLAPSCIYSNRSTITIQYSSVSLCHAGNFDEYYGNFCSLRYSKVYIHSLDCMLSADSQQNAGDSLIHFQASESSAKLINTSFCFGTAGSASIACWNETSSVFDYKYVNIIHSYDFSSLEIIYCKECRITGFNFVNTSNNIQCIINNVDVNILLTQCVFIGPHCSQLSRNSWMFQMDECVANIEMESTTITTNIDATLYPFTIDTHKKECNYQLTFYPQFYPNKYWALVFIFVIKTK